MQEKCILVLFKNKIAEIKENGIQSGGLIYVGSELKKTTRAIELFLLQTLDSTKRFEKRGSQLNSFLDGITTTSVAVKSCKATKRLCKPFTLGILWQFEIFFNYCCKKRSEIATYSLKRSVVVLRGKSKKIYNFYSYYGIYTTQYKQYIYLPTYLGCVQSLKVTQTSRGASGSFRHMKPI